MFKWTDAKSFCRRHQRAFTRGNPSDSVTLPEIEVARAHSQANSRSRRDRRRTILHSSEKRPAGWRLQNGLARLWSEVMRLARPLSANQTSQAQSEELIQMKLFQAVAGVAGKTTSFQAGHWRFALQRIIRRKAIRRVKGRSGTRPRARRSPIGLRQSSENVPIAGQNLRPTDSVPRTQYSAHTMSFNAANCNAKATPKHAGTTQTRANRSIVTNQAR